MDFIDPILSIASEIYTLVENVKANKKRCRRVSDRVKALEELVRSINKRDTVQASAVVGKALKELSSRHHRTFQGHSTSMGKNIELMHSAIHLLQIHCLETFLAFQTRVLHFPLPSLSRK